MGSHLDIIGWLLTAIVFSVGFFSTRAHTTAQAAITRASDASWRLRQELADGTPVAPQELASLLAATTVESDRVATLTRALNGAMALACCLLTLDGLRLYRAGDALPRHGPMLALTLLVVAVGIVLLGEFDARSLQASTARALGNTTLGRLERLAAALTTGDQLEGRRLLELLQPVCHGWVLLDEIEALLLLQRADAAGALDVLEQSQQRGRPEVYLGPTIAAAASIGADDLSRGIDLLDGQLTRAPAAKEAHELRFGLGLLAGHLDQLIGEQRVTRDGAAAAASNRQLLAELLGEVVESRLTAPRAFLDFGPKTIPATATLLDLVERWTSALPERADPLALVEPGSRLGLIIAVIDAEPDATDALSALASSLAEEVDARTIETLAVLQLVRGQPRQAVRSLERAVALRPSMARLHWDLAIAYHAVGWIDTAVEANARAIALDGADPLYRATERWFISAEPAEPASAQTRRDDLDLLQWTFVGASAADGRTVQHSPLARALLRLAIDQPRRQR